MSLALEPEFDAQDFVIIAGVQHLNMKEVDFKVKVLYLEKKEFDSWFDYRAGAYY